jgi:hypothetical protein
MSWAASEAVGSQILASRDARILVNSELPGCPIRSVLLADVGADLLQFKPDGGYCTAARAQKCSPVKFLSLPQSLAIAMALFPFRNPITDATVCLGGSRYTYAHGPA